MSWQKFDTEKSAVVCMQFKIMQCELAFLYDHNQFSIDYANINVPHTGSLRIKLHVSFSRNLTFYKWCVTKVAHCMIKHR